MNCRSWMAQGPSIWKALVWTTRNLEVRRMTDISMRTYDTRQRGMDETGSWAVGGMTLLGLGAGFFFLQYSALLFVASVMAGIGAGVLIAASWSRGRA